MTTLFQLSENCDLRTSKEEQVRDQLIDKCRSHDLCKKLLAVSGKRTARLATCMKCKKVEHFAKVCKTKEEDTIRPRKRNIHQVTKDDDFAFTLQSSGKDCRNRLHCFITKLISDIGHCVLFDIFLFSRFDHARFFCNNILISMFFDGAN